MVKNYSPKKGGITSGKQDTKFKLRNLQLHLRYIFLGFLIGWSGIGSNVLAIPSSGQIVAGQASITSSDNTMQIHQTSNKAIINWQKFDIQKNETVHFQQPVNGVALNRINPSLGASQIYGRLSATGKIILINQAGIYFGPSARVDVGGLIASTSNISNENFLAGNYVFDEPSTLAGSIINEGEIIAANHGLVALIGTSVRNDGYIQANLGSVVLASGSKFTFDFTGDQLINFSVDEETLQAGVDKDGKPLSEAVSNRGKIIADGGKVLMSAKVAQGVLNNVVNMSGVAQARSVYENNGEIILSGNDAGVVRVSGKIDASGKQLAQKGGTVKVLGKQVAVENTAEIDASGDAGGGKILIGGNVRGTGPEQNADYAFVGSNVKLNANALTTGNGGDIIVWSNKATQVYGSLSSRGGFESGNGGFIETSSKQDLQIIDAMVDASAPQGTAGLWLLDPHNLTVATTSGVAYNPGVNNIFNSTTPGPSGDVIITPASINSSGANVLLQANNDIIFTNTISITGAGVSLTAQAGRSITFGAANDITTNGGAISFTANETVANGVIDANRDAGTAVITMATGNVLTTGGGDITITMNTGAGLTDSTSGNITLGVLNAGAGNVLVANYGPTAGSGIVRAGAAQLITAGSVALDVNGAGGGGSIGASGAAIRTTTANIEARSQDNVFLAPTGAVNIGDATLGGLTGIIAPTTLSIITSGAGAMTQSEAINAGTLIATNSGGVLNLNNTSNTIATLGTISRGGAFTLNNTTALSITGPITAGTITNAVNIDTSLSGGGLLTIAGNISTSGANNISLKGVGITQNAGTNVSSGSGTLTINGGGGAINFNTGTLTTTNATSSAVTIQNATSVALGTITNAQSAASYNIGLGDITGNITQNATLTLPGTLILNTPGDITLTSANNFGTVTITNGHDVSLTDTNRIILGGPSVVTGALNVTAGVTTNSAITQTGSLSVTGTPTFTVTAANSDVLLTNSGNSFASTATPVFAASGAGTYRDLTLRNASASAAVPTLPTVRNLTLNFDNAAIQIPTLTSSTLTGTLSVTAGGNITQSAGGIITGTVTTTLNSGTNNILLTDTNNNFSTLIISGANNATINDSGAIALGATTVSGTYTLTTGGAVSDSGAISANTLNVTSVGGNALNFGHTINNFQATNTSSGGITLINTAPTLTINGISQSGTTVSLTNTGDLSIASGATVNSGTTLALVASGALTVNSTAAVNSGTTLSITAADLILNGTLNSNNGSSTTTITQNTASGTIGLGDAAGTMSISKAELQRITANAFAIVAPTNGQILVDNVAATDMANIAGTTTLTSTAGTGAITFQGNSSTIAQALTASTSGNFTVNNGITAAAGGGISITALDINLNSTGALNSGTATTTLTQNTASGSIGLGDAAGTMSISKSELQRITANAFTLVAPTNGQILVNNIAITDMPNIAGTTTLTSTAGTGAITFQGSSSTFANALTTTTTGTFTVNDGVTAGTDNATLSINAVDLNLNISGALSSGTGTTTLTQNTAGNTIGLGDAVGDMSISKSELQRITANAFNVTASSNGQILVNNIATTDMPTIAGTTTLTSTAGTGAITFQGNSSTFLRALTASTSGIFTVNDGITAATNDAALSITAQDLNLNTTGALNSGTALLTITKNATLGTSPDKDIIELGNPSGTAFRMGISASELQRMTAGTFTLSASNNGQIIVNGISANDTANIAGLVTLQASSGSTGNILFSTNPSSFKTLTVTADNGIAVNTNLSTTSGTLTLTTGAAGTTGVAVNVADGVTVSSNDNAFNITANDLILNSTGALNSGLGTLTITQNKTLGTIGLGDSVTGDMHISGSELQNITTANLTIVNASNSQILLGGITSSQSANITAALLRAVTGTAGSIAFQTAPVFFKTLTANADSGMTIGANVNTSVGAMTLTAGTGSMDIASGVTLTTPNTDLSITATGLDLSGNLNAGTGVASITTTSGSLGLGSATGSTTSINNASLQNIIASTLSLSGTGVLVDGVNGINSNTVTLTSTGNGQIIFQNNSSSFKTLVASSGNGITVNAPVITTVGNLTLDGNTGGAVGVLNLNSNLTAAGSITLSASGGALAGITLGAPVALTANGITFSNQINSGSDLTLNSGSSGDVTFDENVTLSGRLTISNAYNVTNSALITASSYLQEAGNVTSFGSLGMSTTGNTNITAHTANGELNVGSLSLNLSFANLTGTVDGQSGQAGADQIVLAHTILPGTQFFDGIDLADTAPPTPPIPPVPPVPPIPPSPIVPSLIPQEVFSFLYAPTVENPYMNLAQGESYAALIEELDLGKKSCVNLGAMIKMCSEKNTILMP